MSRTLSLTSDPITRLTWRIALPASIGMFFNTMFNFVDTYCAGLLSTDALAALSLSFPVFFLLLAVGSGLSQGATALVANALGSKKRSQARLIFAQSLTCTFFAGLAVSGIGRFAAPSLFRQLGAEGEYLQVALSYINTLLAGGVFFLLTMTLSSALNAQGETRVYRNFLIGGCLANLFLNPFLMWGWLGLRPMGVAGIALATVIVQFFGVVWLAHKARSSELFCDLPVALFRPHLPTIRLILSQSVPAALNMMTVALGIFVISWFVKHFGKEAIAASGIATRIEQVVLMPAIGLNTAVLSIVGQNHGAGLPERVREAWLTNIKYALVVQGVRDAVVHGRSRGHRPRRALSRLRFRNPCRLSHSFCDRLYDAGTEAPGIRIVDWRLPPDSGANSCFLHARVRSWNGAERCVVGHPRGDMERRIVCPLVGMEDGSPCGCLCGLGKTPGGFSRTRARTTGDWPAGLLSRGDHYWCGREDLVLQALVSSRRGGTR